MKNVKFASISDQLINTAIIMDMMFNTEIIVKDMKGGKEDMTEKRFIPIFDGTDKRVVGAKDNGKIISFMDMFDLLNDLSDENEQLRKENDMLSCELSVSANKEISRNCRIAELEEENKELKQYKQSVNDVLKSWSQKNVTAKQLQVVLAIMEELNVIGDVE